MTNRRLVKMLASAIIVMFFSNQAGSAYAQISGHEAMVRWIDAPVLANNQCLIIEFEENVVMNNSESPNFTSSSNRLTATKYLSLFESDDFIVFEDSITTLSISPDDQEIHFAHSARNSFKPIGLNGLENYYNQLCGRMLKETLRFEKNEWILDVTLDKASNNKEIARMEFYFNDLNARPIALKVFYSENKQIKSTEHRVKQYEITENFPLKIRNTVESYIYTSGKLKPIYKDYKIIDSRITKLP